MGYMDKPVPGTHRYAGAHGGVRGGQSASFEGRFRRMFPDLPQASFAQDDLTALGQAMSADAERASSDPGNPGFKLPSATPETETDGEENSGISAGYTYLGQFIDHDITFDPVSALQGHNDPNALVDFRSPALDLDCLYGRGPGDQPYMYEPDGIRFRLGKELTQNGKAPSTRDLPRFKGNAPDDDRPARALIGDKRNDENVIVSQLQGAFLQFHNKLAADNPTLPFEEIQRRVRWHYQWVVLNDFLPKIVGETTMNKVWPGWKNAGKTPTLPALALYKPGKRGAYIPIEFSAAAYRFGHSMVRPIYRLNTQLRGGQDPNEATPDERKRGIEGRFFIFAGVQNRGLNGFGEFPSQWSIDWSLYFDINGSGAIASGPKRLQPAYKIDTSLVNPLAFLPEFSKEPVPAGAPLTVDALQSTQVSAASPNNLAVRNLWRGNSMGLPSGQAVAAALKKIDADIDPIPGEKLVVGKAQRNGDDTAPDDVPLSSVAKGAFLKDAPLWYYVLAESNVQWREATKSLKGDEANRVPVTLGPVGGRIVAETLIGLVWSDKNSYLSQNPTWMPTVPAAIAGRFTMGDILRYALDL